MADLRDKILNLKDIPSEMVDMPEWDTKVEVRGMTARERVEFYGRITNPQNEIDRSVFYPELLIASCFDPESGEQLFDAEDRDVLNEKSSAAVERLARRAMILSGMTDEDETDLEETPT